MQRSHMSTHARPQKKTVGIAIYICAPYTCIFCAGGKTEQRRLYLVRKAGGFRWTRSDLYY